jgi:hypothetical protein
MGNCNWDSDSGTLTTQQEKADEKNHIYLVTASWFKDAFADLGSAVVGKSKKLALPPETLFNLKEDWSVKTVHHRHDVQQAATLAGNTPPRKGKGEVVEVASSDEDSASLSSPVRLRTKDAVGDEDSPTSSEEDDGNAVGAADGG